MDFHLHFAHAHSQLRNSAIANHQDGANPPNGPTVSLESRPCPYGEARPVILAFWFGPPTAVKFGPLGRHWLGFKDGATEA